MWKAFEWKALWLWQNRFLRCFSMSFRDKVQRHLSAKLHIMWSCLHFVWAFPRFFTHQQNLLKPFIGFWRWRLKGFGKYLCDLIKFNISRFSSSSLASIHNFGIVVEQHKNENAKISRELNCSFHFYLWHRR